MRAKWSAPVRKYWKWSEKKMVNAADVVVCDSVNIEKYIQHSYHHPHTTFIAYGSDTVPSILADDDPKFTGWLKEKGPVLSGSADARHRADPDGRPVADHVHSVRVPYESSAGTADDEDGDEAGNDSAERHGNLTLPDFIFSTYNSLLENGWKMRDIDEMDMLGYLKVRAWKVKREQEKKQPVRRYIDEVWPELKP